MSDEDFITTENLDENRRKGWSVFGKFMAGIGFGLAAFSTMAGSSILIAIMTQGKLLLLVVVE